MRLEAENAVLRHQLTVLRRRLQGRVRLTNTDRWFLIMLYRWFPSILQVLTIIRPETLIHWHRSGFRCYWRWKSRSSGGRPPCVDPADEHRQPLYGAFVVKREVRHTLSFHLLRLGLMCAGPRSDSTDDRNPSRFSCLVHPIWASKTRRAELFDLSSRQRGPFVCQEVFSRSTFLFSCVSIGARASAVLH